MPNTNLNIRIFPFFNSVKEPVTQDATSDAFFNSGYDTLSLELSGEGTGTLTVQGCINTEAADGSQLDDDDCSWTDLKAVRIDDDSADTSISAVGIYSIGITGLSRIRIKAESVSGNGLIVVGAFSKKF